MKIQKAIWQESRNIAVGVIALSVVMQAIFFLIGKWDITVLWGNLLGGAYAILNFFILGLTVQKVAEDADEKRGKNLMQFSYSTRMLFTMVIVFLGITMSAFNWIAVFIPQLFPRITIAIMGFSGKHAKDAQREQEMKEAAARHTEMLSKKPIKSKSAVDAAEAEAEAAEAEAEAALAKAKAARARAAAAAARAEAEESAE